MLNLNSIELLNQRLGHRVMGKKRKNFKRDEQRLAAFLRTKCIICYTPEVTPSREMPCCQRFIHEHCLLACFKHAIGGGHRCPHCRGTLIPINKTDELPSNVPEHNHVFRFEYVHFVARSAEDIADELFLDHPSPIAPVGWAEFRRRWRH